MAEEKNYFETLMKLEGKVTKKMGLNYISWADAWALLKKQHPEANYKIYQQETGMPYFSDKTGAFVKVAVSVGRLKDLNFIEHIVMLPVMKQPKGSMMIAVKEAELEAFAINKTIQRALTKAIAMHGIGLYVYQGEDLPEGEEKEKKEYDGEMLKCSSCAAEITEKIKDYSMRNFKKVLCMDCQKKGSD